MFVPLSLTSQELLNLLPPNLLVFMCIVTTMLYLALTIYVRVTVLVVVFPCGSSLS